MKYKATIILPCYNKERFIERALDSIISLSRFKDFEVILVDDCSKDNTVKLIKKYEKKYKNITLYEFKKGSGSPSKPRNFGIEKSSGEYLIFMDPDDLIINDGYSVLLNKIEELDSDILIGTRIGVNEEGKKVWTDFVTEPYINSNDYNVKFDLLNRSPFILKTIYKKSLIVDNNIRFNEKITTSEDEAFDMMCASCAKKITKINDIVYQYTAGAEGSITTNVSLRLFTDLPEILKEITKAYKITFSEDVIAERIMNLYRLFYVKRITYFDNSEDMEKACEIVYKSLKKYGFEKFENLKDENNIILFERIKNKKLYMDILDRLLSSNTSFSKKNVDLNKKNIELNKKVKSLEKRIEKLEIKNQKQKKLLNRKIVKVAVKLTRAINKTKKVFKRKK